MKPCAVFGVAGFALLLFTRTSAAQSDAPVQLVWQAPANCPQEAQVRQKLRDLLGASGSGKTTLLRMINRLIEPTQGSITIKGRAINTGPAHLLRRQSPEGVATQPKQAAEAAAMPTWLGGALDRGVERTPQPPRVLPQSSRASFGDCRPVDGHSKPGVERPPRHKGKS